MKRIGVLTVIIFLVACAAYKPAIPTQTDADRAAKMKPGITLAELNEGKSIFQTHCHKCHSLKKPFSKSGDEIEAALPKMAKRAKLDSHEEELVLNYLVTMAEMGR